MDLSAGTIGDVIVEANGKKARRLSDLTDTLEKIKLDDTVTLTVIRNGTRRNLSVSVVDISRT